MERVLAVELLHLLAAEGTYGAQVSAQLDVSDVWHAYRDQKHDLFLPAGGTAQVCAMALHPSIPAVVVQQLSGIRYQLWRMVETRPVVCAGGRVWTADWE